MEIEIKFNFCFGRSITERLIYRFLSSNKERSGAASEAAKTHLGKMKKFAKNSFARVLKQGTNIVSSLLADDLPEISACDKELKDKAKNICETAATKLPSGKPCKKKRPKKPGY